VSKREYVVDIFNQLQLLRRFKCLEMHCGPRSRS
jgi:hypothetical protein